MSRANKIHTPKKLKVDSPKDYDIETEVLFQKIYDKWYAFSLVEDNCLMAEVSATEVEKRIKKCSKTAKAA